MMTTTSNHFQGFRGRRSRTTDGVSLALRAVAITPYINFQSHPGSTFSVVHDFRVQDSYYKLLAELQQKDFFCEAWLRVSTECML